MHNHIFRDATYITRLKNFIHTHYAISAMSIIPAKRGYYGETWKLEATTGSYFVKLDYLPRHQTIFKNSLTVVDYLSNNGIDFISHVIPTLQHQLYSCFDGAILGVFEWIDADNHETDATKTAEYQLLCKVYPLTKSGLGIPTLTFSEGASLRFYRMWKNLKEDPQREADYTVLSILEKHKSKLMHCAARLSHFASLCQQNYDHFYLTHGDAGGNFLTGHNRNYIIDWDEAMYAPLERDAWVMCCHSWARDLFNSTLQANHIAYTLRPERLAFYCYHMFFFYLGEFLADLPFNDLSDRIREYFEDGWINDRIRYADTL